jgi:aminopeptidase N
MAKTFEKASLGRADLARIIKSMRKKQRALEKQITDQHSQSLALIAEGKTLIAEGQEDVANLTSLSDDVDTAFVAFAAGADPTKWNFYKKLGLSVELGLLTKKQAETVRVALEDAHKDYDAWRRRRLRGKP